MSLDAPLVALAWQELFARDWGGELDWSHRILIFASVWLGYSSDRWFDTFKMARVVTHRHAFHRRHRRTLSATWLTVLAISLTYAFRILPETLLHRGLALAGSSLLLTLVIQRLGRGRYRALAKSVMTSFLILGASTIFVFPTLSAIPATSASPTPTDIFVPSALQTFDLFSNPSVSGTFIPALVVFVLFVFNCLLIHRWDTRVDQRQEVHLSVRKETKNRDEKTEKPEKESARRRINLPEISTLVTGFSILSCAFFSPPTAQAALCSFVLLIGLDKSRDAIPLDSRRTLADIALLSPFLVLLYP